MTPYEAFYHRKPTYGRCTVLFWKPWEIRSRNSRWTVAWCSHWRDKREEKWLFIMHHPQYLRISQPTWCRKCCFRNFPKDSYLEDISQPIPDRTRVFGPDLSPSNLNCVVCNFKTSGAHYWPGCNGLVHIHCGITGEKGYGSHVYCNKCEVTNVTRQIDSIVAEIKRRKDKLHIRMLVSAGKKFCPENKLIL